MECGTWFTKRIKSSCLERDLGYLINQPAFQYYVIFELVGQVRH